MAYWRSKKNKQDTTRCDSCGYNWNYAWRHQCKNCHENIRATIPAIAAENRIEWPQNNQSNEKNTGLEAKSKLAADTIAKCRQNGYSDDHPILAAALEDSKQLKQERADDKGFWAQQQSHSSKIVAKQNKLAKQQSHLDGLQQQRLHLDQQIVEAQKVVTEATKEISDLEEEAKTTSSTTTPALAWTLPDYCSETLQAEYKKLEEIQKSFAAQIATLKQQAEKETLKKQQEEAAAAAKAERERGTQAPASGSVPMETDDLAEHLGSDEIKKMLGANLAEGADISNVTKHLLEGLLAAKEAKRRKKG